jgi:hypothetical protein
VRQIVATLGQRTQCHGLVLKCDLVQPGVVQRYLSNAARVGGIGLAAATGGQQSGTHRQCGRDIHHVLAGGRQPLRDAAAEAVCAFRREPALRPLPSPGDELFEGAGVDHETALPDLGQLQRRRAACLARHQDDGAAGVVGTT